MNSNYPQRTEKRILLFFLCLAGLTLPVSGSDFLPLGPTTVSTPTPMDENFIGNYRPFSSSDLLSNSIGNFWDLSNSNPLSAGWTNDEESPILTYDPDIEDGDALGTLEGVPVENPGILPLIFLTIIYVIIKRKKKKQLYMKHSYVSQQHFKKNGNFLIHSFLRIKNMRHAGLLCILLLSGYSAFAADYYWVGGTGGWSEYSTHWAISSGGSTFHTVAPKATDNVYFDDNSGLVEGSTVTLNVHAVCKDMIWSGTGRPRFVRNSANLTISGSLTLQPSMSMTGYGVITFNGSGSHTISMADIPLTSNITFNGTGSWTLLDDLTLSSYYIMNFTNGNLNFNGQNVKVNTFSSAAGNTTRQLNIANSTIDVNTWTYTGGIVLNAANSAGSLIRIATSFTGKNGDKYDVVEAGTGTLAFGDFNKIIINKTGGILNAAIGGIINTEVLEFKDTGGFFIFNGSTINIASSLIKTHTDYCLLKATAATPQLQAILNMGNGSTVSMDAVGLQNIVITGSTPYPISNGNDMGGNSGWQFNDPIPTDMNTYFWKGGERDKVLDNVNNWELGYPGSGISPSVIFSQYNDICFPLDISNPASMTLKIENSNSLKFRNLTFDASTAITLNWSSKVITGTGTVNVNKGSLTLSAGTITTGDLNVSVGAALTANAELSVSNATIDGSLSHGSLPFKVREDIRISGVWNLSSSSVTVSGNVKVNGYGDVNRSSVTNPSFYVTGDLITSDHSTVRFLSGTYPSVNISGNVLIGTGTKLQCEFTNSSTYRMNFTFGGNLTVNGSAIMKQINCYFKKNINANETLDFINCNIYLQSANPYIFNLGASINNHITGGELRFDAAAAYSVTEDFVLPSTDIYITANNGSFSTNGHNIRCKNFQTSSKTGRTQDFSGTTFEVHSFIALLIRAGEILTDNTNIVFWGPTKHVLSLSDTYTINTVTFTNSASIAAVHPAGLINKLISSVPAIELTTTGTITIGELEILKPCDIFSATNPTIKVEKITGPQVPLPCEGISMLRSTGNILTLQNTGSSQISLNNLYCNHVNFTGTATPTAFTSPENFNLGDCSGSITWTDAVPEIHIDYYWIGGAGSWFNPSHWSFTSGGEPANCLPTAIDNAIFDENSFSAANQTVEIDTVPALIHHITWSDPLKEGRLNILISQALNIYGSSDFTGCYYAGGSGKIYFLGTGNETVTSGGLVYTSVPVYFNHSGTYSLQDDLIISQSYSTINGIFHQSGTLNSNGHKIQANIFKSESTPATSIRNLDLSGSEITLSSNNSGNPDTYSHWTLSLTNLNTCNLSGTTIKAKNVITNGTSGQSIQYNDVIVYGNIVQTDGLSVSYNNLYSMAGGSFEYGFTANNLFLKAYNTYTFKANSTTANEYKILGTFTTDATECNCNADTIRTVIKGTSVSYPAKINVVNAPFELIRVNPQYINCTGQTMHITDGVNLGNNTNVVITEREALPGIDFYWVGDAGKWSDPSHWSIGISGGDPAENNPFGCIPSPYDNVYFDGNSFSAMNKTVTLDITGYCRNMTWTAEAGQKTPSFNSTYSYLNIYGFLELVAGMKDFSPYCLFMKGTSQVRGTQYIRMNGFSSSMKVPTYLYFSGEGIYDLLDECSGYLCGSGGLYISKNSSFYSNENTIRINGCLSIDGASTTSRIIDLSGSYITATYMTCTLDNYTTLDINGSNINMNNTSSGYISSFVMSESCIFITTNSIISSGNPIELKNSTSKNFAFHNIKMTGTGNAANLGRASTTIGPFSFNKVEFTGALTSINSAATYTIDSLVYARSSSNTITAGRRVVVKEYLWAQGTPCGFVELKSSSSVPAVVKIENCNTVIGFGKLSNITADISSCSNTYPFTVIGYDQGGNTNVTFDSSFASATPLGKDTTVACNTLPFIQTTEGFGVGETYIWTYRAKPTDAWKAYKTATLENGGDTIHVYDSGDYQLNVNYGGACNLTGVRHFSIGAVVDGQLKACQNDIVELWSVGTSADGNYIWNTDGGTLTESGQSVEITWSTPGIKKPTVTYKDSGGNDVTVQDTIKITIVPLATSWIGKNTEWNDPANWSDGIIPGLCTVVTIKDAQTAYPILSDTDNAQCDSIRFEANAEVARTNFLTYTRGAAVDLRVNSNRWYMVAPPLQNMYSGDYILSSNRISPKVWMQQYQTVNPQTATAASAGKWSSAFNTLNIPLDAGMGYVIWVSDDEHPDNTFRFPRYDKQYQYFDKTTGAPQSKWDDTPRTNPSRLVWETGTTIMNLPVKGDAAGYTTAIVGNPFMSHMDFIALAAKNPSINGNHYYLWNGGSFDAFTSIPTINTAEWTGTSNPYIAPMQSFIVEKANPASTIATLEVTPDMSVTSPGSILRSANAIDNPVLKLTVSRENKVQSGIAIVCNPTASNAYDPAEDAMTLFSETVKDPAILYSLIDGKAASINTLPNLESPVALGIRTTRTGELTLKINEESMQFYQVYLEDRTKKEMVDLLDGPYTFINETGNIEGRFFLHISIVLSDIKDFDNLKNSTIKIYPENETIHIISSSGNTICNVEITGMQGQTLIKDANLNTTQKSYHLTGTNRVVVVKVRTDQTEHIQKVIIK